MEGVRIDPRRHTCECGATNRGSEQLALLCQGVPTPYKLQVDECRVGCANFIEVV